MPTTEEALQRHRRWVLRPECRNVTTYDELFQNEFLSEQQQHDWQCRALKDLLKFAVSAVPHYRHMFQDRGLNVSDIASPDDLSRLPVVTKHDIIDRGGLLQPEYLPVGQSLYGHASSSGTTGRRVTLPITVQHNRMFNLLWHRQVRWFDMEPSDLFCEIRPRGDIGRMSDGSKHADGVVRQHAQWRYLGQHFQTGSALGFNLTNPIDQQVAWLREYQPHYIMTDPGLLEEILLASDGRSPSPRLKSVLAVSSQLTEEMRARLEDGFRVPVHQTYGLNEIGKVALRCEAGRYHVHTEHCLVEIADEDGRPCAPGETGRILVTGFRNVALPLIRYDTGDLAEAVSGPCPCGCTLPTFGKVHGRFRRYATCPPGTRQRFLRIALCLKETPPGDLSFLRQYQVHQSRENRFQLRMRTIGPIPEKFTMALHQAWHELDVNQETPLEIVRVDTIARSPGGKVLDFTSDFHENVS